MIIVGAMVSRIVISTLAVDVFPLTSVAEKMMVCVPTSLQSNVPWLRVSVFKPQESHDPLLNKVAAMLTIPIESK